jgi:ankyrin repeat protein
MFKNQFVKRNRIIFLLQKKMSKLDKIFDEMISAVQTNDLDYFARILERLNNKDKTKLINRKYKYLTDDSEDPWNLLNNKLVQSCLSANYLKSFNTFNLLSCAALLQLEDMVLLLIKNGADTSVEFEGTPLITLISMQTEGDPEIIRNIMETILVAGPDGLINVYDIKGHTPLMNAIVYGSEENVISLCNIGRFLRHFNVNMLNDKGKYTALHCAIRKNNPTIVKKLLDAGLDPSIKLALVFVIKPSQLYDESPENNLEILKILLEDDRIDVNIPDRLKNPLMILCGSTDEYNTHPKSIELIKLLLDNGADPFLNAVQGPYNAIQIADINERIDILLIFASYFGVENINNNLYEDSNSREQFLQHNDLIPLLAAENRSIGNILYSSNNFQLPPRVRRR